MALTLVSATVNEANLVRVKFSEPVVADVELYRKTNYVFTAVRGGGHTSLYTSRVVRIDSTTADVTLTNAVETGAVYRLTVVNVSAQSDGALIQDGPLNYADFSGTGVSERIINILSLVPTHWNTKFGSNLFAILGGIGSLVDSVAGLKNTSALQLVYDAISLGAAEGEFLSFLGQNYGVKRPDFTSDDDDLFRKLIPIYATKRKAALKIFYEVFEAILGPAETGGWRVFEVEANKLIVEVPSDTVLGLAEANPDIATYLHADASEPAATTFPGDYFLADSTAVRADVGGDIILLYQLSAIVVAIEDTVSRVKASGIDFEIITV